MQLKKGGFIINRNDSLANGKILSVLIKLSVPATMAMMVNAIYNIVDTIFIGRGVGTLGIAGVAIFLPIQIIILSIGALFGVGGGSAYSRAIGEKNKEKSKQIIGNVWICVFIISVIISIGGYIFSSQIVSLFGASLEVRIYATDYANAMFIGTLVFPLCVSSNNIIRAEGASKDAMIAMVLGAVINIFLDYIFIFIFDLGIWGAGLATSISKYVTFGYIVFYFIKKTSYKISFKHLKIKKEIIRNIFAVGVSAFIIQVSTSLVAVFINYSLSKLGGDTLVAIYGIVYKINMLFLLPMTGFVQGMQPIIGFNKGAKNYSRIFQTVKTTSKIMLLLSLIGMLAVFIFPETMIGFFSVDKFIISEGAGILKIVICMMPIVGIYMILVGLFQSLGDVKMSLFLSILRQPLLLGIFIFSLPKIVGKIGFWIAFPMSDMFAFILVFLICIKKIILIKRGKKEFVRI